jgi:hypothetical protein
LNHRACLTFLTAALLFAPPPAHAADLRVGVAVEADAATANPLCAET